MLITNRNSGASQPKKRNLFFFVTPALANEETWTRGVVRESLGLADWRPLIPISRGLPASFVTMSVSLRTRRRRTTAPDEFRPTTLHTFLPRSMPSTAIFIIRSPGARGGPFHKLPRVPGYNRERKRSTTTR